tara:strand:- start:86 stop:556 length:471 start_codon:yes stop_codon:yes gene_type:complete
MITKYKRKALFLDRDGVINHDTGHVHRIQDFIFNAEIFKICKNFQNRGFLIFIITNQAGIAKGYYDLKQFQKLNDWMLSVFNEHNISITKVYFCPHHPDFDKNCACRKPEPGMILKAKSEFNLDIQNSFLFGDKSSDIEAGKRAGIKNLILYKIKK